MHTELFMCLIKRNNQLLIKGFSYDRKKWFKLPKEYRPVDQHPLFASYKSVKKCIKQSKVHRLSAFRITKAIRANYLDQKERFVFKNKLLEEDSTVNYEENGEDFSIIIDGNGPYATNHQDRELFVVNSTFSNQSREFSSYLNNEVQFNESSIRELRLNNRNRIKHLEELHRSEIEQLQQSKESDLAYLELMHEEEIHK